MKILKKLKAETAPVWSTKDFAEAGKVEKLKLLKRLMKLEILEVEWPHIGTDWGSSGAPCRSAALCCAVARCSLQTSAVLAAPAVAAAAPPKLKRLKSWKAGNVEKVES